ncbi:MAG: hypothetical protein HC877_23945 [Thioploca sp.]|nr:hypothetical protein [Thioploca sp.]
MLHNFFKSSGIDDFAKFFEFDDEEDIPKKEIKETEPESISEIPGIVPEPLKDENVGGSAFEPITLDLFLQEDLKKPVIKEYKDIPKGYSAGEEVEEEAEEEEEEEILSSPSSMDEDFNKLTPELSQSLIGIENLIKEYPPADKTKVESLINTFKNVFRYFEKRPEVAYRSSANYLHRLKDLSNMVSEIAEFTEDELQKLFEPITDFVKEKHEILKVTGIPEDIRNTLNELKFNGENLIKTLQNPKDIDLNDIINKYDQLLKLRQSFLIQASDELTVSDFEKIKEEVNKNLINIISSGPRVIKLLHRAVKSKPNTKVRNKILLQISKILLGGQGYGAGELRLLTSNKIPEEIKRERERDLFGEELNKEEIKPTDLNIKKFEDDIEADELFEKAVSAFSDDDSYLYEDLEEALDQNKDLKIALNNIGSAAKQIYMKKDNLNPDDIQDFIEYFVKTTADIRNYLNYFYSDKKLDYDPRIDVYDEFSNIISSLIHWSSDIANLFQSVAGITDFKKSTGVGITGKTRSNMTPEERAQARKINTQFVSNWAFGKTKVEKIDPTTGDFVRDERGRIVREYITDPNKAKERHSRVSRHVMRHKVLSDDKFEKLSSQLAKIITEERRWRIQNQIKKFEKIKQKRLQFIKNILNDDEISKDIKNILLKRNKAFEEEIRTGI